MANMNDSVLEKANVLIQAMKQGSQSDPQGIAPVDFVQFHEWQPEALVIELAMRAVSGRCIRCGSAEDVRAEPCRTAYVDQDRNLGERLCRPCAVDYHEYWDEMWSHVQW